MGGDLDKLLIASFLDQRNPGKLKELYRNSFERLKENLNQITDLITRDLNFFFHLSTKIKYL